MDNTLCHRQVFLLLALVSLLSAACGELREQGTDAEVSGTSQPSATAASSTPAALSATATATTPPMPSSATIGPGEASTPVPVASPQSLRPGDTAKAGGSYRVGPVAFRIPPDAELSITITLSDPSGNILVLYDPASGSSLKLDPATGKELERYITEPKWNAVFDLVVASIQGAP